uniref:F-box domain-containing protein n=1 Tax=Parastrongyloides trichosuri TaxID=131310 RepID=A0A0N4ZPA8_PARTI
MVNKFEDILKHPSLLKNILSYITSINDILNLSIASPIFANIIEELNYEDMDIPNDKSIVINFVTQERILINRHVVCCNKDSIEKILSSKLNHCMHLILIFPSSFSSIFIKSYLQYMGVIKTIFNSLPYIQILEFDCIKTESIHLSLFSEIENTSIKQIVCSAIEYQNEYGVEGSNWFLKFSKLESISILPTARNALTFLYYLKKGLGDRKLKYLKVPEVLWFNEMDKIQTCEMIEFSMEVFEGIKTTFSMYNEPSLHLIKNLIKKLRFTSLDIIFSDNEELECFMKYFNQCNITNLECFRIYIANPASLNFGDLFSKLFRKIGESEKLHSIMLSQVMMKDMIEDYGSDMYSLKKKFKTIYKDLIIMLPAQVKSVEFKGEGVDSEDLILLSRKLPNLERLSVGKYTVLPKNIFEYFTNIKDIKYYCNHTKFTKLPDSLEMVTCCCACDFINDDQDPSGELLCWSLGVLEKKFTKCLFKHDSETDETITYYGNSFIELHRRIFHVNTNLDWVVEKIRDEKSRTYKKENWCEYLFGTYL